MFPIDDGGVDKKYPTEIAISDRRNAELAKNGFRTFFTGIAVQMGASSWL
jgi:predicted component of type VI protein secretion system